MNVEWVALPANVPAQGEEFDELLARGVMGDVGGELEEALARCVPARDSRWPGGARG